MKIKEFYTKKGPLGKTMLEIGLEEIKPIDEAIKIYEEQDLFFEKAYDLSISSLHNIYGFMESKYREYYDKLTEENDYETRKELIKYQHETVTKLTKEIIKRQRKRANAKENYRRIENGTI